MALNIEKARELSQELGFWPASTDEADVEAHRRAHAADKDKAGLERIQARYAPLREEQRRARAEADARASLED